MRRLALAATILLLAGCGPATPEAARNGWGGSRKPDISCLGNVKVVHEDHYDLNRDGRDEVFLIMRCEDPADPRGDQFEVLAHGDDGPPTKLVLQMPPTVVDQLCFAGQTAIYRVTEAGKPVVRQVKWLKDKPEPGPQMPGPAQACPSPR